MKLYAKILDKEGGYDRVVLCQFESGDGDKVFVEEIEMHKEQCFKVLLDEGCSRTTYYYPIRRYSIVDLAIYE